MVDEAADRVAAWVRPEIRALSAYHVPEAAGLVKLDAMENPYAWPDELRDAWAAVARETGVNRYPHPQAPELKAQLRAAVGIPPEADVLLGNGSDEIIQMIALALAGPDRVVLSVDPGFVMYRMIALFAGMRYVGVPLRETDFGLDLPALLDAVRRERPAVVFVAYPNNPTGNLFAESDLVAVIEAAPGLVVVDEAYAPFTDASFLGRVGRWPNLVVMRTVSKMGLAGLRLGYLVGPAAWLQEFEKVRLPYNINVLTQRAAELALRHKAVLELAAQKADWSKPLAPGKAGEKRARGVAVHESFGTVVAQVAEVTVKDNTFRVDRVVCAVDCGIAVNPDIIRAQMEGGIGFGLSAALYGKVTLKDGLVEQSNFHDYPLLRISEMPAIDVHIVPSTEKPSGVGEPGVPVIAPAVANALAAATGKRVRALPLSLA